MAYPKRILVSTVGGLTAFMLWTGQGCNQNPTANDKSMPQARTNIAGKWIGKYEESGLQNYCSYPYGYNNCSSYPYAIKNTFELDFLPNGLATEKFIHYRNNNGDSSESNWQVDSIKWSVKNDSLDLAHFAHAWETSPWQAFDTLKPPNAGYPLIFDLKFALNSTLNIQKFPNPDTGVFYKDVVFQPVDAFP